MQQARTFRHRRSALTELYERAKALPGERRDLCRVIPKAAPQLADTDDDLAVAHAPRLKLLRERTARWVADVAARSEEPLLTAMSSALGQWDQVDAMELFDHAAQVERKDLARMWSAFASETKGSAALNAAAVEALTVLDAVSDLLQLMERRLATFIRLRLSSDEPELSVGGRPFLDIAAALQETAEAFR